MKSNVSNNNYDKMVSMDSGYFGNEDYAGVLGMMEEDNKGLDQPLIPKEEISPLSTWTIFLSSLKLGCISFGGTDDHQKLLKKYLVQEYHSIYEKDFDNLLDLCVLLPGYSSSTLLAVTCTINTKSVPKGFLALLSYNLPSLLLIIFFSYLMNLIKINVRPNVINYDPNQLYFTMNNDFLMFSLWTLGAGLTQAALAILIYGAVTVMKKLSNTYFQMIIVAICLVIYFAEQNFTFLAMIMVTSGISSMVKGDHDYLFDALKPGEDDIFKNIPYTGFGNLLVYLIMVITLWATIFKFDPLKTNMILNLCYTWLKTGAFCIGEGHVLIPFIFGEYKTKVEENEILNGYALVSLLPGSLLNTATYIGGITARIIGGILSGFLIFLPGFLFVLCALPNFKNVKYNSGFQCFIRGACSAGTGFIFACVIKLWIDSCIVNPYTNHLWGTLNVVMCYYLIKLNVHKTFVLVIGSVFIWIMEIISFYLGMRKIPFLY